MAKKRGTTNNPVAIDQAKNLVEGKDTAPCEDPTVAGAVVSACQIDLPRNDVVESIDFERFFFLNLSYGDVGGPATLPLGSHENRVYNLVPFSANKKDWAALTLRVNEKKVQPKRRTSALEAARNEDALAAPQALNSAGGPDLAPMQLALYLPFRQQWKLRGYNRGRLVNSFTLAPQEEQTVEIFKWDRITRSMDSSTEFESEDTNESSSTRRDTRDVARDVARQTGFETNSSGKVGFKVGVVNADLSAGFNARAGVNDAEKETRGGIVEATARSTGLVRTSRTLKVVESREQGQESRTTRKLRNPNVCHTLTVAFSEILANYEVNTFVRADQARLVVLVNSATLSAIDHFTAASLREHETPLRLALLDRALADGFDAARFLDARERACKVLCQGCICEPAAGNGQESTQLNNVRAAAASLATTLATINSTIVYFPLLVPGLGTPAQAPVDDVRRYAFRKALQSYAPSLLGNLNAVGLSTTAASITVSQLESINRIVSGIAQENWPKLTNDGTVRDGVRTDIYGAILVMVVPEFIAAAVTLGVFWARLSGLPTFDDFGLTTAISSFSSAYATWTAWLATEAEKDEKLAALRRIEKQERDLRVLEAFPLRATAEAQERLEALLAHLNDPRNRDHYRFAVWNERSGATDSTLMTLALAGLVEPNPVGLVGDLLAVPLKLPAGSKFKRFFDDSLEDLLKNPPHETQDHILPTPALYAEAIAGQCCACEESLERNTQLDLDRRDIENQIRALEARRLEARLDAATPLLDRDGVAPPVIKVEVANATTTPTP
jgi:hypothetical protein